jgi:putative membrane protein
VDSIFRLQQGAARADRDSILTSATASKLSGAAFDKEYVDNEVAYQKAVNGALQTTLIPAAQNPDLKALLETGLKLFQGHEQHAEHVASMLK